jgi:hypothetical protein
MASIVQNLLNTKKIADLSHDTVEVTNKTGLTTDFGASVNNTDDWYAF